MKSAIKKIIKTCPGITALLLINILFPGAAHAQTVDSLTISCFQADPHNLPSIITAIPLLDGKIMVSGVRVKFISRSNQSHTNLVRLNSDGSIDDSFVVNISVAPTLDFPAVDCIALQTNGQILIGGSFSQIKGQTRYNIGRLNADGALDTNFNAGLIYKYIGSIIVQTDGKILICGAFTEVNSQSCMGLCRLNSDGSRDTNFNAGANNSITALALQPDGKIVAEGFFTSIGGQSRSNLARLNADGSLDATFRPVFFSNMGVPGFPTYSGSGVLLAQPDGKILVGGFFDHVNGLSHTNIVRLNADGTLDTNFNAQADFYNCNGLQTLALQTDGKILVGDDSLTLNGHYCPGLGRLNMDGSLDASFHTNLTYPLQIVGSSAIQSDGKILLAGDFNMIGGLVRDQVCRLINTEIATQCLNYDGTNILWLRGGASPEVWRTSFESSTNRTDWTYLGDGTRISGGWQLSNVFISTNTIVRARGFIAGGWRNGSSWFVESTYPQTELSIVKTDGNFGLRNNCFGFNLEGNVGSTVVVDTSSTLLDWTPIATNVLPSGPLYFSDPSSTNHTRKFYRVRLQQ